MTYCAAGFLEHPVALIMTQQSIITKILVAQ